MCKGVNGRAMHWRVGFPNGASAATNKRRSRGGCVGSRWLRSRSQRSRTRSHGAVVVGLDRQRCRSARNAIKCENGGCLIIRLINVDCDCDPSSGQELLEGHTGRAGHTMVTHSCEAQKHLFGDRVLP